ncbi:ATPase [Photobacterium aquae]|uniref:histidine kinase n=1 Tax=Photobacterium aquae TaxID=1195763 RepID=A0A0J1JPN5_9GAMM|nr:HAMP domain-containing sensor histidine kinase [Photobacterium aquae]KLV04187.1 ATPase [Photobacterium aquae]
MTVSVNKAKSAKQLTFTYFAAIAFAILTLHFTLMDSTLDDFEQLNANNRLTHARQVAMEVLAEQHLEQFAIPPFTKAFVGKASLPDHLAIPDDLPYGKTIEVERDEYNDTEYFIQRNRITNDKNNEDLYLLYYDDIFEISEEQILDNQLKQLAISFILLTATMLVVLKVSGRLTHPLSELADNLEQRSANDLSPVEVPSGTVSRELLQLVDSFNRYMSRIDELLNRERAFNRYASHELRTPLMVIKGATSLLGQSHEPTFIEKQRLRLQHASDEMNDFVTTLLSLTREENFDALTARPITKTEITQITLAHTHLISSDKHIEWQVLVDKGVTLKIPENTLNILLGNLIKNAFAYTDKGSVEISVSQHQITVCDTGMGLGTSHKGVNGYGLGLLIANDICRKYGWKLEHRDNPGGGCCACITFKADEAPNI